MNYLSLFLTLTLAFSSTAHGCGCWDAFKAKIRSLTRSRQVAPAPTPALLTHYEPAVDFSALARMKKAHNQNILQGRRLAEETAEQQQRAFEISTLEANRERVAAIRERRQEAQLN